MLDQLFSLRQLTGLVGALMILGAFAALHQGKLSLQQRSYHLLNLVGSAILTVIAVMDRNLGFILLEGAWALLSIPGAIRPTSPDVSA